MRSSLHLLQLGIRMQNSTVYHATLPSPNNSHVGGSIHGCHLAAALRAPCSRGVQHSISSSPLYGPTVSTGYRNTQVEVVLAPFSYLIVVCMYAGSPEAALPVRPPRIRSIPALRRFCDTAAAQAYKPWMLARQSVRP
jgi:hypothetical protein